MSQVHYRFYEDRDAEGILDLFKRNAFYLGRRPVSAAQFRESLTDRGAYFAVIGEDDERIIAYLAAYPAGDGKVCRKHQVVMGGLLVDEKYRGKLYSISTIYTMAVRKIIDMHTFTTIISEVECFRKQSLLMQRYFGSVNVNRAVMHHSRVNQMYNFLPGYILLFDEESESRKEKMTSLLEKADKRTYDREDEIIDHEYVNTFSRHSYGRLRMLVHIHTGIVEEVELEKIGLLLGLSRDRKQFVIRKKGFADAEGVISAVAVKMWKNGAVSDEEETAVTKESQREIPVEEGIERIHVSIGGIPDGFWFYPIRPVEIKRSGEKALWGRPEYTLDTATGYFTVKTGQRERIVELWPFMNPPYLTGDIEPDYELSIESAGSDEALRAISCLQGGGLHHEPEICRFKRELADCVVLREYCRNENEILIRTVVRAGKPLELKPRFQYILRDAKARICFVTYKDNSLWSPWEPDHAAGDVFVTELPIDEDRDAKTASREIPFERFVEEPYSEALLRKITVEEDDFFCSIETSKRARAYLQFYYLGINYDMSDIPYKDGCYDFGMIRIRIGSNRR